VVFVGSVRQGESDGPVVSIDYSAYETMAQTEVEHLLTEARSRWPGTRADLEHRLGRIPAGEASIAVVVAAPHRAEAFEACRWVVEQVKHRVPIWKKEIFEDGSASWRDNEGRRGPASVA
jgi:molybdopterin synthase catalytic subunit